MPREQLAGGANPPGVAVGQLANIGDTVTLALPAGTRSVGISLTNSQAIACTVVVEHRTAETNVWDPRFFFSGDRLVPFDVLPNPNGITVRNYSATVEPADTDVRIRISAGPVVGGPITAVVRASTIDATALLQNFQPNGMVLALATPFSVVFAGGSGAQGTIQQPAGVGGRVNICTAISTKMFNLVAMGAAGAHVFVLRDGLSGVGTILFGSWLSVDAVAGSHDEFALSSLWIQGSMNTAMTLEFTAAPAAGRVQSVELHGLSILV